MAQTSVERVAVTRRFYSIRGRGDNQLDSNLTELVAAEAVDRGFMNHNDWMAHALRYQRVCNTLERASAVDVLDVGCGRLQLPYYAYRNRVPPVRSYWGIDLRASQSWVDESLWKADTHLVRADFVLDRDEIDDIPGFPGFFEVVVYMEAHEHIPKDRGWDAMDNIYHWMAPGATLFFSTPNAGVSQSTADNHRGPNGESREWTFAEKKELLSDAGLEVVDCFGTFGAVRRLPPEAWENPVLLAARRYLSTSMFSNFAFIPYPEYANNAMFVCVKP